jgi:hypothetical protein
MENKRVIYIEWVDAVGIDGWQRLDYELHPAVCVSIGFLVSENDKYITICQGRSVAVESMNGVFTIPKGWIKKRKFVKL